jgi:hypothetical protein
VLEVARVDDDIQAGLHAATPVTDLASMSATAFEEWLLTQAADVIDKSFPQLSSLLPLIDARRDAVKRLEQRLRTERSQLRNVAAAPEQGEQQQQQQERDDDDDDAPVTSVSAVAELRNVIAERRTTAALLREATSSLVAHAGKASGDVELQKLLTSDQQTKLALAAGGKALPDLLRRIPSLTYSSLAEENARNEQSVMSRLFNQRVDFLQESRLPVSLRWWGATVDLSHADVQLIFTSTTWLGSMTALLGKLLAGEPNALVLQVVVQFAAFYGVALAHIDRGAGIRFCVPWIAVGPIPNPLLVVPTPL